MIGRIRLGRRFDKFRIWVEGEERDLACKDIYDTQ